MRRQNLERNADEGLLEDYGWDATNCHETRVVDSVDGKTEHGRDVALLVHVRENGVVLDLAGFRVDLWVISSIGAGERWKGKTDKTARCAIPEPGSVVDDGDFLVSNFDASERDSFSTEYTGQKLAVCIADIEVLVGDLFERLRHRVERSEQTGGLRLVYTSSHVDALEFFLSNPSIATTGVNHGSKSLPG